MSDVAIKQPELLAPHSESAEEALLGSVLLNPECFLDAINAVKSEDFFIVRNAWVFDALEAIHSRGEDIDNLTVIQELNNRGRLVDIGGPARIAKLINDTPTHVHFGTYAGMVAKCAVRRRILAAASEAAQISMEDDSAIDAIIEKVLAAVDAATEYRGAPGLMTFMEAANGAMDEWLEWAGNPADIRGYRTGIRPLDYLVGGFLPGRVCSLLMPTSGGKSTISRQILGQLITEGPGLLCPTEMSASAMMHGMVTQMLQLDSLALQRGLNTEAVAEQYAYLMNRNAYVMNAARPTVSQIETLARKLRRRFPTQALWMIVDSGSNVDVPNARNIFDKTSKVSNTLAQIAVDYNFFVFVTWQINRQSYSNASTSINAGRGGGDIENDSDYVFTVDSDEYKYKAGLSTPPAGWQPQPDGKTKCSVRCLKSRHNPIAGRAFDAWFVPGRGIVEIDPRTNGGGL